MKRAVLQRFKEIKDYYKLTDSSFAQRIGVSQTTFSNIMNRESDVKQSVLEKVINSFGDISAEWLLTGLGDMLKEDNPSNTELKDVIKYYPNVEGSMGGVTFLDNPNEQTQNIILPGFSECKYAINAYGDSMHPVIKSGQIVVLQEWRENFIEWGKIYLIVTKNGYRTIKYVVPSGKENAILCKSENKDNPPFEIDKQEISNIFLVKGWVCRESI